jgi:hypothetical protein
MEHQACAVLCFGAILPGLRSRGGCLFQDLGVLSPIHSMHHGDESLAMAQAMREVRNDLAGLQAIWGTQHRD